MRTTTADRAAHRDMKARRRGIAAWVALLAVLLMAAPDADAIQFALNGDERVNIFNSGLSGTGYDTPAGAVDYDALGSLDPHPGEVQIAGTIASLNYHTTGAPGTNVNQPFGSALTFSVEAQISNAIVTPVFGTFVQIDLEFVGTPDGNPDVVVTDPTDATVLLEAQLVPGMFDDGFSGPVAVAPLTTTFFVDTAAPNANQQGQTRAFFQVDAGSLYASLFGPTLLAGITTGTVSNFEIGNGAGNDFDDIQAALLLDPTIAGLISHVAEANGQIFGLEQSQFQLPEPSSAWLVALGLAGFFARRRRSR